MEVNIIGGYEVGKEIGKGAFGTVYSATKDDKEYALKEIRSCSRNQMKMIAKEADIMSGLHHENVVMFIDFFKEVRASYFVMAKVTFKVIDN